MEVSSQLVGDEVKLIAELDTEGIRMFLLLRWLGLTGPFFDGVAFAFLAGSFLLISGGKGFAVG